jgi:DNA-binding IclR family transcriptional regulator
MTSREVLRPVALSEEAGDVLGTLAAGGDVGLRLNVLSALTGLPVGHVGRHLRTLERERLARERAGAWRPTPRGELHAARAAA